MSPDRSSSLPDRAPPGSPRVSVLVLDDDQEVSQSLRELIEDQGYRAICVANGRDALAVLEHERPSLMLVDLFMPVMNGVEFLHVVKTRESLAAIPRVIMTATNDYMIGVKEDLPVLYKPIDLDSLLRMLRKYCDPCPVLSR